MAAKFPQGTSSDGRFLREETERMQEEKRDVEAGRDLDETTTGSESIAGTDTPRRDGSRTCPVTGLITRGNGAMLGSTRMLESPKGRTLQIWDWDDTLFPSSWINQHGLRLDDDSIPSDAQRRKLDALSVYVEQTIRQALSLGEVVVITNAEEGWVDLSCQKFFPQVYPLVRELKIISARTMFETQGVFNPLDWKMKAFGMEVYRVCSGDEVKNIMSYGDSIHEREALLRICSDIPVSSRRAKSVKFVERPSLQQLTRSHMLMRESLPTLVGHDGDLDMAVHLPTGKSGSDILMPYA